MGILSWIGIGADIAKPIQAVGDLYTTDKARIEAETGLQTELEKGIVAQTNVNAILASSSRWFNSGWQPMIGWTSGFLVLLYYFPQLIIATYIWGSNCLDTGVVTPFPIKPDDILNLVYLLFGFGVHHLFNKKSTS
jgi:hypothetical protein